MNLPAYEVSLSAYHAAFEPELRRIIEALPMDGGERVADMGSGDGFFAAMLLDRLPAGTLACVDADPSYLAVARARLKAHARFPSVRFREADVRRLPFGAGEFDVAWCAQSLYSFPDPVLAIGEIARTVAAGGVVAVLENDTAHHVLLPWPPDVEIALRAAELESFRERNARADRFYIGRGLAGVFAKTGLSIEAKRTFSWDRTAPFDGETRRFLDGEVADLRKRAWAHLTPREQGLCWPLLDPASPDYILAQPGCGATVIDQVVWGRKA